MCLNEREYNKIYKYYGSIVFIKENWLIKTTNLLLIIQQALLIQ